MTRELRRILLAALAAGAGVGVVVVIVRVIAGGPFTWPDGQLPLTAACWAGVLIGVLRMTAYQSELEDVVERDRSTSNAMRRITTGRLRADDEPLLPRAVSYAALQIVQSAVVLVTMLLMIGALWAQGLYVRDGRPSVIGLATTGFIAIGGVYLVLVRWPRLRRFIRANQTEPVDLGDPPA